VPTRDGRETIPTEYTKSAGAVLCLVEKGSAQVLLLLQNNAFYGRNKPEAVIDIGPKGKINEGEDERAAALREIKEETGLELKLDDRFKEELVYQFDDISRASGKLAHIKKTVVFFLAYITQEDVDSIVLTEAHVGCRLLRIGEAMREVRHESQKKVLRVVEEYIRATPAYSSQ
jgi:8-oxo-dGTP pyrophosphatase MutT (NUDIX family)